MHPSPPRNRLALESSLYLLQHASNPVDWYPWGDEALALALRLDRPILLSIGYSACHWCHVMERECFEDAAIAALMNERFVCIKVDREERPDLDQVYMKALQGMTGRGGWPMTMFLTPDARPFYGGTYFPPKDRGGMPGFPRVLLGVSDTWARKRDEVLASAGKMVEFLDDPGPVAGENVVTDDAFLGAAVELVGAIDTEHGGFGRAPKFPATMALGFLMEWGTGLQHADEGVRLTLDRMADGGIRDHLGGGFHRYSVDREWLVPHFEKMLYDQAQLALLYIDACRCYGEARYGVVASEIVDYVLAEMTSPDGGFFSAQDADSEGEEGKHFVWSRAEVLEVLGTDLAGTFCLAYDVTEEGNFEGRNILRRVRSGTELEEILGRGKDAIEGELRRGKALLLEHRRRRPAPATDRKILTDWNGLMISAIATVGAVLQRKDFLAAARRAQGFLRDHAWDGSELFHVHANGAARVPGFLDDHAFLGRACLDLFGVEPDLELLEMARWCADRLIEDFRDGAAGGFHFTSARGDRLVARTSDLHDGAVPAGNSVAAELLLRLWELTGEDRYRESGDSVLRRFVGAGLRQPYGSAMLLGVAGRNHRGGTVVVVTGAETAREELFCSAFSAYSPGTMIVSTAAPDAQWLPPALKGKAGASRGARAYVCRGATCGMPLDDPGELFATLHRGRRAFGEEGP